MKSMFVPGDLQIMLDNYNEKSGDGPCGPSCLAVIEQRSIRAVLQDWKPLFGEYRGWAAWKELRQYLESKGYTVKLRSFKGEINPTAEKFVICRVQWLGPDPDKMSFAYGWRHWSEAAAHTHFILVADNMVFCSENGWFSLEKLNDYLENDPTKISGVVTSYMEVSK